MIFCCVSALPLPPSWAKMAEIWSPDNFRTSSKRHVLLCVRHAGEIVRCLVPTDQVILLDSDNRSQRIANDDHAQSIVQGCAGNVSVPRRFLLREKQRCCDENSRQYFECGRQRNPSLQYLL